MYYAGCAGGKTYYQKAEVETYRYTYNSTFIILILLKYIYKY